VFSNGKEKKHFKSSEVTQLARGVTLIYVKVWFFQTLF